MQPKVQTSGQKSKPRHSTIDFVDNATNIDFRYEQVRLNSFERWPVIFIKPVDLAANGFYFTKHSDGVKCFECSLYICKWVEGDTPATLHKRWSSTCRFIKKLPCGNIPIEVNPLSIPLPVADDFDVYDPIETKFKLGVERDSLHLSPFSWNQKFADKYINKNNIKHQSINEFYSKKYQSKKPYYPEYSSLVTRVQSFSKHATLTAEVKVKLAEAGFFCTKIIHHIKCYHCAVTFENWQLQDDPFTEHVQWVPDCYHLLMYERQEFANSASRVYLPITSSKVRNKTTIFTFYKI